MIQVEIPGKGLAEFPDEFTQDQITEAIHASFPDLAPRKSAGEQYVDSMVADNEAGMEAAYEQAGHVNDQIARSYHTDRAGSALQDATRLEQNRDHLLASEAQKPKYGPLPSDPLGLDTVTDESIDADVRGNLEKHLQHREQVEAIGESEAMKRLGEAESFSEGFKVFAAAPIETTVDVIASSAVPMARVMLSGGAGAITAGPPGLLAGTAAGSYDVNLEAAFMDELQLQNQERGDQAHDLNTVDGLAAALKDKRMVADSMDRAKVKAGVIAGADTVTMGAASATIGKPVTNAFVQSLLQMGGGAGGEAGGAYASGRPIEPGEVIAEAVGETATTAVDVPMAIAAQGKESQASRPKTMLDRVNEKLPPELKIPDPMAPVQDSDIAAERPDDDGAPADHPEVAATAVNLSEVAQRAQNNAEARRKEKQATSAPEGTPKSAEIPADSEQTSTEPKLAKGETLDPETGEITKEPTKAELAEKQVRKNVEDARAAQEEKRIGSPDVEAESRLDRLDNQPSGKPDDAINTIYDPGDPADRKKAGTETVPGVSMDKEVHSARISPGSKSQSNGPTDPAGLGRIESDMAEISKSLPDRGVTVTDSGRVRVAPKQDWQGTIKEIRTKVGRAAMSLFAGRRVLNRDAQHEIIIPKSGIKKTLNHIGPREGHHQFSVMALPELVAGSRYIGAETDRKGRGNFKAIHKYQTEVDIDGSTYGVEIVVRENGEGKRFYHHMLIDGASAGGGMARESKPSKKQPADSIQDLGEKVGGARKDEAPKSGNSPRKKAKDDRPAWARRFEILQTAKSTDKSEEGRFVIHDKRKKDFKGDPRPASRQTFATQEEAEAAIPLLAVTQKHTVRSNSDGKYEIWRNINDRKTVKVVNQAFDSRDAAREYMAKNAVEIIETRTSFGEADIPVSPDRKREGPERRTQDVEGQDFLDTYGFRGVEFGNWNNQDDRQALLNDAYDGLLDLADVLDVPPRALSLNGELALAFGARGHGLHSARAHYEPAKAVINLTKMKGAGTLAHEWFHSMDHYFARQDGQASSKWETGKDGTRHLKTQFGRNFVSHGDSGPRSGMREEVREVYRKLMNTMSKRAETFVEDTARVDDFVGRMRDEVGRRLNGIRSDLDREYPHRKRKSKPASAEQLVEFDTIAQEILDGQHLETESRPTGSKSRSVAASYRTSNDALETLSKIIKEVRGRSGFTAERKGDLDKLRGAMSAYRSRIKMLEDAQGGKEKTRMIPTDFAREAKQLDQGRNENYWTTPHEMAARAFQGYVEDAIARQGGVSRFLNYAPEGAAVETAEGFKFVYPRGDERKAINKVFDELVDTLQTRKEGENVVLYKRDSAARRRGVSAEQAASAISRILKANPGAKSPKIARTYADFPKSLRGDQHEKRENELIKGVWNPADQSIYLNLEDLQGEADIERALLHENYHYAIDRMTRDGSIRTPLTKLYRKMGGKDGVRQLAKKYDVNLDWYDELFQGLTPSGRKFMEVNELLAHIGEKGRSPFRQQIAELLAAVKQWLENHGFTNLAAMMDRGEIALAETLRDVRNFLQEELAPTPTSDVELDAVNDLLFSRGPVDPEMLDKAGAEQQKQAAAAAIDWLRSKKESVGHKKEEAKPGMLGSLTLRQLVDIGQKHLPEMAGYMDSVNAMLTRRNTLAEEAGTLAEKWQKWATRNKDMAGRLYNVMHQATIAGVDPSKEYAPLSLKIPKYMLGEGYSIDKVDVEANVENLRKLQRKRSRMIKSREADRRTVEHYTDVIRDMKTAIGQERNRQKARNAIETNWANLTPEAQQFFEQARDMYQERSEQVEAAIIKKIESSEADEANKKAMVSKIRQEFEKGRVEGPYFPLQRFGNWTARVTRKLPGDAKIYRPKAGKTWKTEKAANIARNQEPHLGKDLSVVEQDGGFVLQERKEETKYLMYESYGDRVNDLRELESQGWVVKKKGRKGQFGDVTKGASEGFVSDVILTLQKNYGDQSKKAQDDIYQLYLATLPHLSQRKHFIHRGKVQGYDPNALRAFAHNMNHQAHQISKLEHSPELDSALREMNASRDGIVDSSKADALYDETLRRHDWIMNPTNAAITNKLSGLGFFWYLGATPAAGLINLTQTPILGIPTLGAEHGNTKAFVELNKSLKHFTMQKGGTVGRRVSGKEALDPYRNLGKEEQKAFRDFQRSGVLDRTQAHNLAGIGDTDAAMNTEAYNRTMEAVSWMFHHSEIMNREITLLAAYRLARKAGKAHQEAVDYATKATWEIHFDYSNANRARWMQHDLAKIFLMFRSYSQHMTYFMVRNLHQSLHGESKQAKRQAMNKLAGALGMTSIAAGATGLPLYGAIMGTLNLAQALFGEDDEPWDAEIEFRRELAELGFAGKAIDRGLFNAITGADLSTRVSLNELWVRTPDRELSGRDSYRYWLEQLVGPIGGIVGNGWKSMDALAEGKYDRFYKQVTPKFMRDIGKAFTDATEGRTNWRGDPVVKAEEFSALDHVMQAVGFTPDLVRVRYEENNARRNYVDEIDNERRQLVAAAALAMMEHGGKSKEWKNTITKIRQFNTGKGHLNPIKKDTIQRSVGSRSRYTDRSMQGQSFGKRYRRMAESIQLPE